MTLTKKHIVQNIIKETGLTKHKAVDTVEHLLEIVKSSLVSGEELLISGFGKFNVKSKYKRKGRNPASGEDLMLDARRVVMFKCSGKLREMINREG